MPLQAAVYQTDRNWRRKLHIHNAFCCGNLGTIDGKVVNQDWPFNSSAHSIQSDPRILHIAMCHAGASVSTWNQIFAMNVSDQWDELHFERHIRNAVLQVGVICKLFYPSIQLQSPSSSSSSTARSHVSANRSLARSAQRLTRRSVFRTRTPTPGDGFACFRFITHKYVFLVLPDYVLPGILIKLHSRLPSTAGSIFQMLLSFFKGNNALVFAEVSLIFQIIIFAQGRWQGQNRPQQLEYS